MKRKVRVHYHEKEKIENKIPIAPWSETDSTLDNYATEEKKRAHNQNGFKPLNVFFFFYKYSKITCCAHNCQFGLVFGCVSINDNKLVDKIVISFASLNLPSNQPFGLRFCLVVLSFY